MKAPHLSAALSATLVAATILLAGDLYATMDGASLGAQPLLLTMPINGTYYDALGIPCSLRQAYYDKLDTLARAYGVRWWTLPDHDGDIHFNFDSGYHLNRKGWVDYDQALDAFCHDTKIPDAR